jgi:hypothetical protein
METAEWARRVAGEADEWATTWADAAARAAEVATWADFDPCGLLERLIRIDNNAQEAK